MLRRLALLCIAFLSLSAPASAERALVAVAANFTAAAKEIGAAFEAETGHRVVYAFGATGQLYAQIAHAAPFDAFLAADAARPARLEAEGLGVAGARFTYAFGKLALWSADPEFIDGAGALERADLSRLAIANPAAAPYGAAAVEALKALGLYDALEKRLVQGRNIAQTREFVAVGAAAAGFVAASQAKLSADGSAWMVPAALHAPIRQDAILLARGAENPAARAFLAFLRGPQTRAILARHGYDAG